MNLQPSQYAALKAAVLADPQFNAAIAVHDWPFVANVLNAPASPAFTVYKAFDATGQAGFASECATYGLGNVISYVALAALTSANLQSWQVFYQLNPQFYDSSRSDIQNFMANIWSGALGGDGATTRAALLAYGYRPALYIEKIYATGTGSTASPAKMVFVGMVSSTDVQKAMTS